MTFLLLGLSFCLKTVFRREMHKQEERLIRFNLKHESGHLITRGIIQNTFFWRICLYLGVLHYPCFYQRALSVIF